VGSRWGRGTAAVGALPTRGAATIGRGDPVTAERNRAGHRSSPVVGPVGVAVATAEKPTDMGSDALDSGSVLAAPGGVGGGGVSSEGFGSGAGVALEGAHGGVAGAGEQHRGVGAGLGVVGQRGVP